MTDLDYTLPELDPEDFNSCVNRAQACLENIKKQIESEGYTFRTCLKSTRWAIEQAILNGPSNSTMMFAADQYVERIESREELENGIFRIKPYG